MTITTLALLSSAIAIAADAKAPPVSEECAIIAEVARTIYRFDRSPSPPLRASGDYLPDCQWSALGINTTDEPTGSRWLNFARPRIDGDKATVRTGVMYGRLNGRGAFCTLAREDGEWRVVSCRRMWAS